MLPGSRSDENSPPLPGDEYTREAKLIALLCEIYNPEEFRRFIASRKRWTSLSVELPTGTASLAELVEKAVGLMARRNLLDEFFWHELSRDRPRQRLRIVESCKSFDSECASRLLVEVQPPPAENSARSITLLAIFLLGVLSFAWASADWWAASPIDLTSIIPVADDSDFAPPQPTLIDIQLPLAIRPPSQNTDKPTVIRAPSSRCIRLDAKPLRTKLQEAIHKRGCRDLSDFRQVILEVTVEPGAQRMLVSRRECNEQCLCVTEAVRSLSFCSVKKPEYYKIEYFPHSNTVRTLRRSR